MAGLEFETGLKFGLDFVSEGAVVLKRFLNDGISFVMFFDQFEVSISLVLFS